MLRRKSCDRHQTTLYLLPIGVVAVVLGEVEAAVVALVVLVVGEHVLGLLTSGCAARRAGGRSCCCGGGRIVVVVVVVVEVLDLNAMVKHAHHNHFTGQARHTHPQATRSTDLSTTKQSKGDVQRRCTSSMSSSSSSSLRAGTVSGLTDIRFFLDLFVTTGESCVRVVSACWSGYKQHPKPHCMKRYANQSTGNQPQCRLRGLCFSQRHCSSTSERTD